MDQFNAHNCTISGMNQIQGVPLNLPPPKKNVQSTRSHVIWAKICLSARDYKGILYSEKAWGWGGAT